MLIPPKALHHVGFIISDMARSVAFYGDMFGAEPIMQIKSTGGPQLASMFDLDDVELDLTYLGFPNCILELVEIKRPDDRSRKTPKAIDLCAGHFCVSVDNIQQACSRARAHGVRVLADPITISDGPGAGLQLTFIEDPDGNRIELMQLPPDM